MAREEIGRILSSRMLKNAHQSRASRDFPHPSPCQARGRLVAANNRGERRSAFPTPRDAVYPELVEGGALHLDIFEHPGKDHFFSNLPGKP